MKRPPAGLGNKRAELIGRLRAALETGSDKELADLNARLQALDALEARLKPSRSLWVAPLLVGILSVLVIGAASLIPDGPAAVALDANVDRIEFTPGAGADSLVVAPGGFDVTQFGLIGSDVPSPSVGNIAQIDLEPSSRLEMSVESDNCLGLAAHSNSRAPAMRLVTLPPASPGEAPQPPDEIHLGSNMRARFCLANPSRFSLVIAPRNFELSQLLASGPPEVRTSSIVTGTMQFDQTGGRRQLGRLDRFRFADIRSGTLLVQMDHRLRITFAGEVGAPESLQAGSLRGQDLTPTVLDVAANSPSLKSLFGILTGLAGMLWAAYHYFSASRRR